MSETTLRQALVEAGRASVARELNHGASGNLSVRTADGFLIIPTGMACDALAADDLVAVSLDSGAATRPKVPSSEWRVHRDLYLARPDLGAIVHAHPRFCTTIACLREDLQPVHYMLAVTGSDRVRCSDYATFGTEELSRTAAAAMGTSRACLLANHGLVTAGRDLAEALRVALEVETVAEYWWRARAIRCGTCDGFPCLVNAKADAQVCCVDPALEYPNVTLMTDTFVSRLETSSSGREITKVHVENHEGKRTLTGDIVVASCGAINSAALLLRSANDKHPRGLGNGSDMVGRHYMGHVNSVLMGYFKMSESNRLSKNTFTE